MKKISLIFILVFSIAISPLLSSSKNVKGFYGLFEIAYPFTLSKGTAGFTLGVNNIDLKTADIDINRFFVGVGWGVVDNLELNINFSYNRVRMLEPGDINFEYPYAERWQEGLGYASIGLKYNFTKNEKTGFGILGYFDLPLSDEDTGVSTSKSKFGIDLLFAHKLQKRIVFSLNAGYQINQAPEKFDVGDTIRYAAGIEAGIGNNLSFATQLAGKIYSGSDLEQDSPLDLIIGLKFQSEDKFGISIGYKKNILFTNKSLGDTHGAIGSIWINTGKPKPKIPLCTSIEAVNIEGENGAKVGEVRSYQALVSPETSTKPITYKWTCSENGDINSGQGTPTVSVKWQKEGEASWIKINANNKCSNVSATKKVKVVKPVLSPKEEYYFAFDQYELSPATIKDLDKAVEYFKYHPDEQIEIQGHTCSIATEEYNLALGEHRADAVRKYLVDNGISPDKIKTISYGEEKPAYDNSAEITRKKNRRAHIPTNKKK